ncbi:hypothetical protein MKZ38_000083 [Zalerion maritima]|uniref:Structure-specific endonuclease subunit SLX4 n=1 Tax=Zalerion maritima TaxID=339359 RepID=A0AAD5WTY0_9PEZI|nr:hypothetical protein MKZ38_000083 [Zalerion maritima]
MASIPIVISSSPGGKDSLHDLSSSAPGLPRPSDFFLSKQPQKDSVPSPSAPTDDSWPRSGNALLDSAAKTTGVALPVPSLWDVWSDDDMAPPPSNQNAFMAEREERQRGPSQPSPPMVESTKQLAKKRKQQKNPASEKQGVLAKGKVTKAIKNPKNPDAKTKSRHFLLPQTQMSTENGEPFGLELATPRRADWTPTKEEKIGTESRAGFQSLLESFGRKEDDNASVSKDSLDLDVLKKRKVTELVAATEGPAVSPRAKGTKKKARTITELATAAYAPEPKSSAKPVRPSKTKAHMAPKFLSYDGKDKVIARRGGRKVTKPKKAPSKAVNIVLPVLPPSDALQEARNQDFVFGTSSQLVCEQPPPPKDSERDKSANSSAGKNNRLWMAGARDEVGELLDIVSLVDPDDVPGIARHSASKARRLADEVEELTSPKVEPTLQSLSEETSAACLPTPAATAKPPPPPESNMDMAGSSNTPNAPPRPDYQLSTDAQLSREITTYGFKPIKRRAAMIALLNDCWDSKHGAVRTMHTTSNALASTTTVTGTKKPRGRPKKTQATEQQPIGSEAMAPQRGRPRKKVDGAPKSISKSPREEAKPASPKRKGKAKSAQNNVLILANSESEVALSPLGSPISKSVDSFSQLDIDIGTMTSEESLGSPPAPSISLVVAITQAVTSAPRSKDTKNPTWHEKMLMYDPIIVEDLAEWLNSGQLRRAGWDKEATPLEVKKWCVSKSICCLWRKTQNGQERKRLYG